MVVANMDAQRSTRTLRTILAADVVGYSRHMSEAESETIASLSRHREIIDALIVSRDGRTFTTAGDSVVAEFANPDDAVQCALDIQEAIRALHSSAIPARPLKFRIGMHTGDVVRRGGSLLGDTVNVAARLESIAEPGGLLISREVKDFLDPKLAQKFKFRSSEALMGIDFPVSIYELSNGSNPFRKKMLRALSIWRRAIATFAGIFILIYVFIAYDGIAFLRIGIGYRMAAANTVFYLDPPPGWLSPGQRVLVDDNSCPSGQIKEVSGGNMTIGLSRRERCVPRP